MVKLQILNVNDNIYTLLNIESNKTYKFSLNFYGLQKLPQVGDFLSFHSELLDKNYVEYSESYQFGPIEEIYGREILNRDSVDYILITYSDKIVSLKRFFG